MNSADICKILQAAKGTNIRRIKHGTFLMEFGDLTNNEFPINNITTTPIVSDVRSIDDPKGHGETTDPKELANEFILAQTMASDPEQFEKMLRDLDGER